MCCQTPLWGLESLPLCPGATPLTDQRRVRRQKIPGVTLQPDLLLLLLSHLSEKLSNPGSTSDPCGHWDESSPLCVLPCLQRAKTLLPAPGKCCDAQLHVVKSAHVEKTHAENKQLLLRYVCPSNVQLGDARAKDIAAMVHAQISGFPSIPGQSHRPLSMDRTPYLAQDRSCIPGSPPSCLPSWWSTGR